MRTEILNSLLDRAASEPFGLVIETNNPKQLQTYTLYNAQKAHPNPKVRELILALPSLPNTLFICQPHIELMPEPEIEPCVD